MPSTTPNATTWQAATNVFSSSATFLNTAAKAGLGEAAPAEVVSAATGLLSAVTALEAAPGMQTLSKISGLASGAAALTTDIPALQTAINDKNASEIALDIVKVTADSCGTVAPLATGAAAVADSNPATIGELGAPLTAVAAAMDTCAASSGALVAAVETGKTVLNTATAIQQYLDDANTDLMNGFIDDAMDYLITGSAVGVPGTDLIGNGVTLDWKTASGAVTTIGFNDSVDASEFAGKGGDPAGAAVTSYGGESSVSVGGLVSSGFSVDSPYSIFNVNTETSASTITANNNLGVDLNITGTDADGESFVKNVGTGSTITLDISDDVLSALSAGSLVKIDTGTTLDKVEASGETIDIGNSADAEVDGTGNGITAGSASKVEDNGTANVVDISNATLYVAAGDSVVVDGNGDKVVGAGSDHISDDGTGDAVYADNSTVAFSGANSGDIVHGAGDTGTDWGGYVNTGGGYGGYGGGGYYAVVKAGNLAAARQAKIGSTKTLASSTASLLSSKSTIDEVGDPRSTDITSLSDISREAAALYGIKPRSVERPTAVVHAATSTASLVQSMAAWGPFTAAFATHDALSLHVGVLESSSALISQSIAHDFARRSPVSLR